MDGVSLAASAVAFAQISGQLVRTAWLLHKKYKHSSEDIASIECDVNHIKNLVDHIRVVDERRALQKDDAAKFLVDDIEKVVGEIHAKICGPKRRFERLKLVLDFKQFEKLHARVVALKDLLVAYENL